MRVPFWAYGNGVRRGVLLPRWDEGSGVMARAMDVSPTVLFALGLKVPEVWTGRPLVQLFMKQEN